MASSPRREAVAARNAKTKPGVMVEFAMHIAHRAHGVVVSHPLSMREALGSIPSVSISVCPSYVSARTRTASPVHKVPAA